MSPESRSTPARLTAPATVKLPRYVLLGLGLAYILAGLFLRDPWKTDDVVGVATMLTALHEGMRAWLLPQVGQLAYAQDGPLVTWVGAAAIWLFGAWIGELSAARLPNLLWFGLTAWGLWYGTYLLGRRKEAQPLALPFGGEPTVRDYGRMLADAALLLLIATAGILWRTHETSEVPAIMAWQALAYYGLARMLDKPVLGATVLGVALAAAFLTRSWPGALPILIAMALAFQPRSALWRSRRWLMWPLLLAMTLVLLWWVPASQQGEYWMRAWRQWNESLFGFPGFAGIGRMLRDLPWFLWPTWPLALVALWRWRAWLAAPHISIPASFAFGAAVLLPLMRQPSEPEFMLLVVPCAVLAAFALPTLRRGVVNTLDWFAVMCFSLTLATVWLGWVALHFGWPAKIAGNIARQTAGFEPQVSWTAFALALGISACWVALVNWRLRTRPAALWRGTVLSACGLSATWLLLVLLWMPPVDYARSYRTVSGELAAALEQHRRPGECQRALSLGSGQRASFLVFDGLNFAYDSRCTLVLQQTTRNDLRDGTAAYSDIDPAQVLWQGGRRADRHEVFRLLRIAPSQ
ncbi:glycosyltransferase [Orrella sp. JC864]|uniref:ArnT family glycosyltransferase n=1 Tax=Orrella sp. JC864 TaxID=3120298 RepID=UPI00142BE9B8